MYFTFSQKIQSLLYTRVGVVTFLFFAAGLKSSFLFVVGALILSLYCFQVSFHGEYTSTFPMVKY